MMAKKKPRRIAGLLFQALRLTSFSSQPFSLLELSSLL
jgi:hypothetical protein